MNCTSDFISNSVKIVGYKEDYQENFKRLNYEWLEKYFSIEPSDEASLNNPEQYIISKGGKVFFAKMQDEVVGCAALIKVSDKVYELSKMAVSPSAQGYGIGTKLLKHGIKLARELEAQKLILYSNTRLNSAIHIYRKYGFEEIELDPGLYDRANIKMQLTL